VARDVEEHDLGDQLVLAERVTVVRRGDERGEQVITGIASLPGGQVADYRR